MSSFLEEYNYIGMYTEFSGTVYYIKNYTPDFYYRTMKLKLKINSISNHIIEFKR